MRDKEPSTITALLGPTNTGKIHHVVELERGHVYTVRLMNRRGRLETYFLGDREHASPGGTDTPKHHRRRRRAELNEIPIHQEAVAVESRA